MSQFLRPVVTIAVTEWKSPGTCANASRSGSNNNWGDVNNAKTQDDNFSYCTILPSTYSDWLRCTNFGFTTGDIPSGATIVGIEVEFDKSAFRIDTKDSAVYLRKTSGQVGDDKADTVTNWALSDTDTYTTYGSSSDTWNSGLVDSDIRDSGFGIDLSGYDGGAEYTTLKVDHVRVRVYYEALDAQSGDWEAEPDDDILFDKMDEAIANDADYAWHNAIDVAEWFEVSLSAPPATPGAGISTVRWRLERIGGAKTTFMKCELREGAVVKGHQEVELTDALQALSFTPYQVTGWKSPGFVSSASGAGPSVWSYSDRCKISDDDYTYSDIPAEDDSMFLRCTDFGFTTGDVPSGATIVGIEVGIERYAEDINEVRDNVFFLRKTTGRVGDDKATMDFYPSSDPDSYVIYGASDDTWNSGLIDSDIRDSGFGIDFSAHNVNVSIPRLAYVDHVQVRIFYTTPISDWTNLRLRFLCSSRTGGGGASDPAITWAEMEVPDAAPVGFLKPTMII